MRVVKPPEFYECEPGQMSIFLAGSIELGKAEDWQEKFALQFDVLRRERGYFDRDWVIYNPRREKWDNTWVQSVTNPSFFQQVTWEAGYIQKARYRVFYFAKDCLSPITLYEFGKYYEKDNSYVCVEEGYLRKGNMEVISFLQDIPLCEGTGEIIRKILS